MKTKLTIFVELHVILWLDSLHCGDDEEIIKENIVLGFGEELGIDDYVVCWTFVTSCKEISFNNNGIIASCAIIRF